MELLRNLTSFCKNLLDLPMEGKKSSGISSSNKKHSQIGSQII